MAACGTFTVALGMLRQRSRLDKPIGLLLAREEMALEKTVVKLLALFRLVWAREKATAGSGTLRRVSAPKWLRCQAGLSHGAGHTCKGEMLFAAIQAAGHCKQQYTLERSVSGTPLLFRPV